MIVLNKQKFRNFCLDIIDSQTPLTELVRSNTENSLVVVYCETVEYNRLVKEYPTKEKLFAFLSKNKDAKYLHKCLYDKRSRVLTIDGGKITDVIIK